MRKPYEPCTTHKRPYCSDSRCKAEEREQDSGGSGQLGVNSEGHPTIGLGSGLTYDPVDGSIGISTGGGFSIDTA